MNWQFHSGTFFFGRAFAALAFLLYILVFLGNDAKDFLMLSLFRAPHTLKRICLRLLLISPVIWVACCIGWVILFANTEYLFGYIDKDGDFVIPPQYWTAYDFENGRARVTYYGPKEDPYSDRISILTIDKYGRTRYEGDAPPWRKDGFQHFGEGGASSDYKADPGLWPCEDITVGLRTTADLKVGYIREKDLQKVKNGLRPKPWVIPPKFNDARPFQDGVAWVMVYIDHKPHWGLINKKGDYIFPPKCLAAGSFHEGLAACRVKIYFRKYY